MFSNWLNSDSTVALDLYQIGRVVINFRSDRHHSDSQVVLDWYWNGLDFSHCGVE